MSVAFFIVLDKEEPGFDTFVNGKALAYFDGLESLTKELGVNTPPAKADGFGLRLKAGLVGTSADGCRYTT